MQKFIKSLFAEKNTFVLLGVTFPLLWMSVAGNASELAYFFCNAGALCAFMLILFLEGRVPNIPNNLISPALLACEVACMALPALDFMFPSQATLYLWVLGGAALGTNFATWFARAAKAPLNSAITAICAGLMGAFLLHGAFIAILPDTIDFGAALIFAAIAAPSLLLITKKMPDAAGPTRPALPAPQMDFLASVLIPFAALALYFGFSHTFPSGILGSVYTPLPSAFFIGILFTLCIFIWLILQTHRSESIWIFGIVFLFIVLVVIVVLFIDRNNKVILLGAQISCRGVAIALLWLLALAFTKRGTYRPLQAFCSLLAFYSLFLCAGLLFGFLDVARSFLLAFPPEGIYLFTACMAAAIAYGLVVVADFYRETAARPELTVVLEAASLDERCASLRDEHKLTDREIEIIKLLAQGRSRSYIAENLYLSENTVKWYCRQIYQKLGIHKKQELLTLLGVE